jgi:carboxymethylenebutenolidase
MIAQLRETLGYTSGRQPHGSRMTAQMIDFAAHGRRVPGYLATPPSGTGPGLLVIQEWWGLVDHIKRVADRFAAEGFVALAPDLYHGQPTTNPDEAGRKMMALDIAAAGQDLMGAADYLLDHDAVAPKKVAALGFCMGGQLALYAATAHDQIAAAVDFYGIHPEVKPDFSRLRGPVLAHFGRTDGFVKEADAQALVARIEAAGGDVQSHVYDAGHAFFNDARPEAYVAEAADLAWERTLTFLRANLA